MENKTKEMSVDEFKKQIRTGICLSRIYEKSIYLNVECDCAQPECHTNIIIELEDDDWKMMTMMYLFLFLNVTIVIKVMVLKIPHMWYLKYQTVVQKIPITILT